MLIRYYSVLTDPHILDEVWHMLCKADNEFIPPLSSRENTYQSELTGRQHAKSKPVYYFEELKKQSFLVAWDQSEVAGFMSFRHHYVCEDLHDEIDTIYITTIIVKEHFRGRGITTNFYKEILKIAEQSGQPITTRTWSTNDSHIRVLGRMGLQEIKRIENGRGSNIDTVYYRKTTQGESSR